MCEASMYGVKMFSCSLRLSSVLHGSFRTSRRQSIPSSPGKLGSPGWMGIPMHSPSGVRHVSGGHSASPGAARVRSWARNWPNIMAMCDNLGDGSSPWMNTVRLTFLLAEKARGGGTHKSFGRVCAARSWIPLPYFTPKYTIFHTLFQTRLSTNKQTNNNSNKNKTKNQNA